MPLEFLKRGRRAAAPPAPIPEDIEAEEFSARIHYGAKTSDGVRLRSDPAAMDDLPQMLGGVVDGHIELVEPLPVEFSDASPVIQRPREAMQWLNAHHDLSPPTLHALVVLETLGALDMAFDTFACGLLSGTTDSAGYPLYDTIVGGVASHWDEATGELIVRAVVGWGGEGARGDTDRKADRILAGLFANVIASTYALGLAPTSARPVPAARGGGVVCAHCGFASVHERAFYCPKCGMRLIRG